MDMETTSFAPKTAKTTAIVPVNGKFAVQFASGEFASDPISGARLEFETMAGARRFAGQPEVLQVEFLVYARGEGTSRKVIKAKSEEALQRAVRRWIDSLDADVQVTFPAGFELVA